MSIQASGTWGSHFALEERLDILQQGHVLRVAKLGIRFGAALLVPADLRLLIPLGQRGEKGLPDGGGELQLGPAGCLGECGLEGRPVHEESARQSPEQGADRGLLLAARLLVLDLRCTLLTRYVARLTKARSSSSRAIRSGLAWKSSRSGRSTVIFRKPNCVVG